ncbi:MAG TPA: hypothetical protein VHF47_06330 [Acidimicrobiales bacterium]|nr:hypothetical protein [Acidimicrobiales bacterium]
MPTTRARRMWQLLEPVHAVVYFAPETAEECAAVGLKGGWMAYFASRAAPMGPVPAEVVNAAVFNFAPRMVHRAIPDAWRFADPADVIAARLRVVDRVLRRLLGDAVDDPAVPEAVDLLRQAVAACDLAGRPLFAAYLSLPWPDEPHLALWHGATLLREHRGDGHVAALVAADLDGCEAHVSQVASGAVPAEAIRPFRGWTDEEWDAAAERLRRRGWTDHDRRVVEDRTDELAAAPWRTLSGDDADRLEALVRPLVDRIVEAGGIFYPNAMGVPRI